MITDQDIEFHPRDQSNRIWTETTYLAFHAPEDALHGTLYVMTRPNLGIAMSSVVIARGIRRNMHEVDFCDPQIHLPCPKSYSDFSLANGLSVRAQSLTEWRFKYAHQLGACAFELDFSGFHHPYDPMDANENPAHKAVAVGNADARIGDAWSNGHFDIKGHITGSLTLRGKQYKIDCFDGMDRSWGPRNETPNRATSYISINMGPSLSLWVTMLLDVQDGGAVRYDKILSGFLVENGLVTPIIDAQVEAQQIGMLTISDHVVVTDRNGRQLEFFGAAIGTRPLGSLNPSIAAFQSLMRYSHGNQIGYGGHGKLFGLNYLAERFTRNGDKSCS